MSAIKDHPLRYPMTNELHARPFPALTVPCRAVLLAIKQPEDAANRDRDADRTHLIDLLDRFGVAHPQPGATHYSGQIGRYHLKWEQHTEFVTYMIFLDGLSDRAFDPTDFEVFPKDWLEAMPGARITSAMLRVEQRPSAEEIKAKLADWMVPESLAASRVLDDDAVVAGDFRIDAAGHMRFAVFAGPATSARRIGRIVQRLCEIETYKTMSMLGLAMVRDLSARMGQIDQGLTALMQQMTGKTQAPEAMLNDLLALSSELESMAATSSFRFGATGAYEAIVQQRVKVLREERFEGRQSFDEFMMRRYDPAMRTVVSTERRLAAMSERAIRASELLRTQVDVERSAQNQALLESMDKRADLQLRLQHTVEGLSVVAISYYAVSLVGYMVYPLTDPLGISKGLLTAAVTPVVVLLVWLAIRRIRAKMEHS